MEGTATLRNAETAPRDLDVLVDRRRVLEVVVDAIHERAIERKTKTHGPRT